LAKRASRRTKKAGEKRRGPAKRQRRATKREETDDGELVVEEKFTYQNTFNLDKDE